MLTQGAEWRTNIGFEARLAEQVANKALEAESWPATPVVSPEKKAMPTSPAKTRAIELTPTLLKLGGRGVDGRSPGRPRKAGGGNRSGHDPRGTSRGTRSLGVKLAAGHASARHLLGAMPIAEIGAQCKKVPARWKFRRR